MPIGPLAAISIAQGAARTAGSVAGGVMDYRQTRRRISELMAKPYSSTEEGKYLEQVGREGIYSPREEAQLMSSVSRATAQGAQEARQQYQGLLASRGLQGSVAAQRGLNEVELARMGQIADIARDVRLSEEQTKEQAQRDYASRATQYDQAREERISNLDYQGRRALLAGITGGVESGLQTGAAYFQGKAASAEAGREADLEERKVALDERALNAQRQDIMNLDNQMQQLAREYESLIGMPGAEARIREIEDKIEELYKKKNAAVRRLHG